MYKRLLVYTIAIFSLFLAMTEKSQASVEWRYEGVAFYVPSESTGNKPLYRFYSPLHKAHFFTVSASEKNKIIATYSSNEWRYEGIAYYVPTTSSGNSPVYRFYSPKYKTHFFTISGSEKDKIISTYPETEWRYEGIAYYVPKISTGNTPVYRFYNTINRAHFFTTSESEKDKLLIPLLGPNITVGLYEYTESELRDNSFRIISDESYVIKNKSGSTLATISANTQTRVKYLADSNHTFNIYDSVTPEITTTEELYFQAASGSANDIIFTIDRPEMNFSQYRGKIKLRYSNNDGTKRIWLINDLPLEYYTWGMGEITGTGPMEYNKMMTTVYRTYGYWKNLYSTAYAIEGFKVDATSGNQIYYGYEWESSHPRIKEGAQATRGKIVKYENTVAIVPYSSWTDGKTRSFEERWGSTLYPWCQSVSDPYGDYNGDYWDNPYKSTADLVASGNHMVGISAHGALTLANDKGWDWQRILGYYLSGAGIQQEY